jgi:hypothetical protein
MIRRVREKAPILVVMGRFLLALVASTTTAGLVSFAMMWFLLRNWDHNDPIRAARTVGAGVAILGVVIGGLAVGLILLIGVWRPLTLRVVVGLGAILGNLPFAFLVMIVVSVQLGRGHFSTEIAKGWLGLPGAVQDIVMGTVTGVISSAIFWMVGIWRTGLEHGRLNALLESTRLAAVKAPRPLCGHVP